MAVAVRGERTSATVNRVAAGPFGQGETISYLTLLMTVSA